MRCQQCHEAGRRVTAPKCLTCHRPVADRIAAKVGVHKNVQECVSCHIEHTGADGDLRHFDTRTFSHATQTRFPLDGQHAKGATNCVACHKTRSFLQAQTTCSSCHSDPHKGALGPTCTTCHSTSVPFKDARARFDHSTTRFALSGAHREATCEQCHKSPTLKGVAFASCTSCHSDPHQKKFGATCVSCHTTSAWTTRSVEHAKSDFPLKGAHAQVACEKCHTSGELTRPLRFDQCSACHLDVHRGNFKEDCRSCHTETTFKAAPFDHAVRTGFALDGKHVGLECVKCHTSVSPSTVPVEKRLVDFAGAPADCVGCHGSKDPHKGVFGSSCEACHRTQTFDVRDFKHPRTPEFFAGRHQPVTCQQCHVKGAALPALREPARAEAPRTVLPVPVAARVLATSRAKPPQAPLPSMACVSCHTDVHLGQVDLACERCHSVSAAKFAAVSFSHERARFPLTGKHADVQCVQCHRTETRAFPSGTGAAMVLHPPGVADCRACHKDPHLGQVAAQCETCHDTATFAVPGFVHKGMEDFFGGVHGRYACVVCHKTETGLFPAGRGTAVRFQVGRTCASCHRGF
jgi:hypothetical protein